MNLAAKSKELEKAKLEASEVNTTAVKEKEGQIVNLQKQLDAVRAQMEEVEVNFLPSHSLFFFLLFCLLSLLTLRHRAN